jgi:hypothetical protein
MERGFIMSKNATLPPIIRILALVFLIPYLIGLSACATSPPVIRNAKNPYGAPQPYGRHPGIDFLVSIGTPVIAPADGKVTEIRKFEGSQPWQGGWIVRVSHADQCHSKYIHLSEIHIELGQSLTRGQLIGLSGAPNIGKAHLHFCICASAGRCIDFSETLDPDNFWLEGTPQCFRLGYDYSAISQCELTLPLACGDYAQELLSRIKTMGSKK